MNYLLWELAQATIKTKTFNGYGYGGYGYGDGNPFGIGLVYTNVTATIFWGDGEIGNGRGGSRETSIFGFDF